MANVSTERVPGIAAARPPVSLLTSGARPLPGSTDWRSGIKWRSELPNGDLAVDVSALCEELDALNEMSFDQTTFYPVSLRSAWSCDWVKGPEHEELLAGATRYLDALTPYLVSAGLWGPSGDTDNPTLESTANDVSAASPVHPVLAVGTLLEAWFSCNLGAGGIPVIHAPIQAITSLISHGTIRQQGDAYYGPLGSIVSPGPGYPGVSTSGPLVDGDPADAGDGAEWIYISGPVEYALGPVEVLDPEESWFHQRMNRYELFPQRQAILRFDTSCVQACSAFIPSPANGESV